MLFKKLHKKLHKGKATLREGMHAVMVRTSNPRMLQQGNTVWGNAVEQAMQAQDCFQFFIGCYIMQKTGKGLLPCWLLGRQKCGFLE